MNTALISRSFLVDVSMTPAEKVERLTTLINDHDLGGDVSMTYKKDVLELMVDHQDDATDWSIRTFLRGLKLRDAMKSKGDLWKNLVTYSITN